MIRKEGFAPREMKLPSLKRKRGDGGRGEAQERRPQLEQSQVDGFEDEDGLVALVKKRFNDVQLLVRRMSILRSELAEAEEDYDTAKRHLREVQGSSEAKKGEESRGGGEPGSGLGRPTGNALANGTLEKAKKTKNKKSDGRGTEGVEKKKPKGTKVVSKRKSLGAEGRSEVVPDLPLAGTADRQKKGKASKGGAKKAGVELRRPEVTEPARRCMDLISSIRTEHKCRPVAVEPTAYYDSTHRRKIRSIVLNPSSQTQFATNSLDGRVNFWQFDLNSHDIKPWYRVDAAPEGHRPERLAWHPNGHHIFGVYNADDGLPQVCMIKNDENQPNLKFMRDNPHSRGALKAIEFMPWDSSLFATAGCDHMVNLWRGRDGEDDLWEPTALHRDIHTSVVSGIAGTRSKQLVLSAGMDKRLIGFDPASMRVAFKVDVDAACLGVLPNPVDFNLVMVGTSQRSKQLHLFDIRAKSQLHVFGWQQSKSESSFTMQSWSSDGFYVTSGSSDPKISIFDIRYKGSEPMKTVMAHTGRVTAAIWHQTLPVILSISADYQIGRHRVSNL